jgi:hypothetical protein
MSIKLLRWRSGSGGDTVLKMLLDSNPTLLSQNKYVGLTQGKTKLDVDYVRSFKYQQIAKMSLRDAADVDLETLLFELKCLEQDDPLKKWLLKTHCYHEFSHEVIDIVVEHQILPFVVKASLAKNSRKNNAIPVYHPLISKITDPKILYKFDCYNMALDTVSNKNFSDQKIYFKDIVGGWETFTKSLSNVNLHVNVQCRDYYESWLADNQIFMPGTEYISLINEQNYDYTRSNLSVEEKYCLLALSNKKFCLLK